MRTGTRRPAASVAAIVAILVIGSIVASAALLAPLERRLVYPARHTSRDAFQQRVAEAFGAAATIVAPFDAIVVEPPGAAVGTALWLHGNGDLNTDLAPLVPPFASRHWRLVLAEYPGYGARAGVPGQTAVVADVRALYAEIERRWPKAPLVVVGQSLGSGIAVQLATTEDLAAEPARLVLATPFLSVDATAARWLGSWLARTLVTDRYDSATALPGYAGPVVVIVAENDALIGAPQGHRLAEIARSRGPTTLIDLRGVGHDDWLGAMSSADWDTVLAR